MMDFIVKVRFSKDAEFSFVGCYKRFWRAVFEICWYHFKGYEIRFESYDYSDEYDESEVG